MCGVLQDHPQENLTMFCIDHVYGGINLLTYFYILATSSRNHCKIISLKTNLMIFLVF